MWDCGEEDTKRETDMYMNLMICIVYVRFAVVASYGHEIAQEAKTQWGAEVAIVHRIGVVLPEAVSVVIAVATPHRAAAYEANRFVLEALKQRVPIWKKEVTPNGASWKENQSPKAVNQQ